MKCPVCYGAKIETVKEQRMDFDESGWFQVIEVRCVACRHTWTVKITFDEGKTERRPW